MIPTCLNCHRRLPGNDVVEAFPYGRRVAYDARRQRFWVVCTRCKRWSLAPIDADERTTAIDNFERWWYSTSSHYTRGGIGIGQYSDRFSLVRIGDAGWNEFACWRYASTMTKRLWRPKAAWAGAFVGAAERVGGSRGDREHRGRHLTSRSSRHSPLSSRPRPRSSDGHGAIVRARRARFSMKASIRTS
jgi:hypothetical protein